MASETEDLNDSWVELHFNNNRSDIAKDSSTDARTDLLMDAQTDDMTDLLTNTQTGTATDWPIDTHTEPQMFYTGPSLMEKLLMDAQRESRNPSCVASREPSCNVSREPSRNVSRVQSRDQSCNVSQTTSCPQSKESSLGGSSPKSPPSPTPSPNPEWSSESWRSKDPGTDWIWDWSSRPEIVQSFDNLNERFRHPLRKKRPVLSMRNSNIMRKTNLFCWANLPTLIFTHAATFFLGAAAVLIYVKKYCNLPAITPSTLSTLD